MINYRDLTAAAWLVDPAPKGNTYFTRVVVHIDGKDYDIKELTLNTNETLGEHFVLHAVPLEV